jgi:hypothetical protein
MQFGPKNTEKVLKCMPSVAKVFFKVYVQYAMYRALLSKPAINLTADAIEAVMEVQEL